MDDFNILFYNWSNVAKYKVFIPSFVSAKL